MTRQHLLILKDIRFFASLPDEVLESLAEDVILRNFKKGDLIIKEDMPPVGCYIILSGTATVYSINNQAGIKFIIGKAGYHSLIGELSVISHENSLFTVEADEEVSCLFLGIDIFQHLLQTNPVISQIILPLVVERLRQLAEFKK